MIRKRQKKALRRHYQNGANLTAYIPFELANKVWDLADEAHVSTSRAIEIILENYFKEKDENENS